MKTKTNRIVKSIKTDKAPIYAHKEKIILCLDLLEEKWGNEGRPSYESFEDPIDGLIKTVLSQNTNDKNRDMAWESLKDRFPSWQQVIDAKVEEVADAIRSAGIANVKAQRIKKILATVNDVWGSCSLKGLKRLEKEEIISFLSSLPGVGPKTIACVLLFDLGIPAFPVDTHVARLSKRLGFVGGNTLPEDIEKILEELVPEERFLGGHLNMIAHGRAICKALNPRCQLCSLAHLCEHLNSKGAA